MKTKGLLKMNTEVKTAGENNIIRENDVKGIDGRLKNSEFGKTVLGEDRRFSMEDVERLTESAKDTVKDAVCRLKELKDQVHTEAQEIRRAAEDALQLHSAEKEIRQERRQAEVAYEDAVRQIRSNVEEETKELKEMIMKK